MSSKSNLNPIKRILTLVLAVAMVFSVNLTSMTAHAAAALPTSQTMITAPSYIMSATIADNAASFYKDDNGNQIYIRCLLPKSTDMKSLESVKVAIKSNKKVTSSDVQITNAGKNYTFTANLLNNAPKITISGTDYIVAAGIKGGKTDLVQNPMSGYVSSASLNGTQANVTRTITEGTCIGNIYYAENNIEWTTESLAIDATNAAAPANNCKVSYTVYDGSEGTATVDLSTSSKQITVNGKSYTVNATFAAQTSGFVATSKNFWIDFTELTDYKKNNGALKSGHSWDTIDKQMQEIKNAQTAWYATNPTFKEGATCMDVLQDFLKFATTNGYFTCGTTDVDASCTYVQNIDGLCPYTLSNGMDGWMYTDNPYQANTEPKNWYTAPIGAADYVLSSNSNIAWFFVTDYSTHPW
ncbi:MAG: hypothetical protein SO020_10000 [Lachnospiraceae bacterium]|nr:hypothetical protein [Clostridiaceae bacterium]MDY3826850.1 hypothetical protein [Lachnospiraceae bacterium]